MANPAELQHHFNNWDFHAEVLDPSDPTVRTLSLCERKGPKKFLRTLVWVLIMF